MQSTSEYLEVSRGVSEYLGDLDLANKRRLTRRGVWVWIIESSSVWGNVWSVVEMEYVRSLETGIFRRRGWNSGVSPNRTCHCKPRSSTPFPTEPSPATRSNTIPIRPPLARENATPAIVPITPRPIALNIVATTATKLPLDILKEIENSRNSRTEESQIEPPQLLLNCLHSPKTMSSMTSMEMKMAISMENAKFSQPDSWYHEAEPHLFLMPFSLTQFFSI